MKRFPINTDNIQEVGYDEVTEILEIEYPALPSKNPKCKM